MLLKQRLIANENIQQPYYFNSRTSMQSFKNSSLQTKLWVGIFICKFSNKLFQSLQLLKISTIPSQYIHICKTWWNSNRLLTKMLAIGSKQVRVCYPKYFKVLGRLAIWVGDWAVFDEVTSEHKKAGKRSWYFRCKKVHMVTFKTNLLLA